MVTRDPKKAVEKVKRHAGIGENLPKPEHIRIHGDAQRSEKWAITQSGDEHAVGGGGGGTISDCLLRGFGQSQLRSCPTFSDGAPSNRPTLANGTGFFLWFTWRAKSTKEALHILLFLFSSTKDLNSRRLNPFLFDTILCCKTFAPSVAKNILLEVPAR